MAKLLYSEPRKGVYRSCFMSFFILFVLNVSPALWVQLSWEVKVSVSPGVFYRNGKVTVCVVQVCVQSELVASVTCLGLCALRYCFGSSLYSFLKPCACNFAPLLPGIGTGLANIPRCRKRQQLCLPGPDPESGLPKLCFQIS